jgi:hypothetical protein
MNLSIIEHLLRYKNISKCQILFHTLLNYVLIIVLFLNLLNSTITVKLTT